MADEKSKLLNKVSPLIEGQVADFVQADHPVFVNFLKQYYQFMEAGQITYTATVNYVTLETTTTAYVLEESAGDRIVTESGSNGSTGKFTNNETITGATSGATATVLVEDSRGSKLFVSSQQKFITGETITGGTSGATGVIGKYRANPNETINQLLEYANVNNTIDDFFTEFRNTFLQTIPNTLTDGLDKRQLTKNIIDLYKRKGTKKGHEIFFRALFNETPEIYYPTVDMLRISDGNFNNQQIIKATLNGPSDGNMNNLVGQTITQTDIVGNDTVDTASSVIESATVSTVSLNGIAHDVATFILNEASTTGTFASNAGDAILLDGTDSSSTDAGHFLAQETTKRNRFTLEQSGNIIVEEFSTNSNIARFDISDGNNFNTNIIIEDALNPLPPTGIKLEYDDEEGVIVLNGTDSSASDAGDGLIMEDSLRVRDGMVLVLEENKAILSEGHIPLSNFTLNSTSVITKGHVQSAEISVRNTGEIALEDATDTTDSNTDYLLEETSGDNLDLEGATGITY